MADGGVIETALILGAVSAAGATYQASEQNRANKKSLTAAEKNREALMSQTADSAQLERMKRLNQSEAIGARLAVSSAERGIGTGGTAAALQRSNAYAAGLDSSIIDVNLQHQQDRIESEAQSHFASITAHNINPLLAAFSGGLSGVSSGLNLGRLFGGDGGGGSAKQPAYNGNVTPGDTY